MSKLGKEIIKGIQDILADKPCRVTQYELVDGKLKRTVSIKRPSELIKKPN